MDKLHTAKLGAKQEMEDASTQTTALAYLDDSYLTESRALVLSLKQIESKGAAVILDQTI